MDPLTHIIKKCVKDWILNLISFLASVGLCCTILFLLKVLFNIGVFTNNFETVCEKGVFH